MTNDDNSARRRTPLVDALADYVHSHPTPFDVPGHKQAPPQNALMDLVGPDLFRFDVNAPRGLDNLMRPRGVIAEAQQLMADACGATDSYFLINGTSIGIIAMIMTAVRAKQKIILPRNVHKSIISGLILSGAIPVFIQPMIDQHLGIANGISPDALREAIQEHPDAVAILIINPTYFGVTSDLATLIDIAHQARMKVLLDEAHGSHLYFTDALPIGGMRLGADMSAMSMHKTSGSLTQSSVLLINRETISTTRVQMTLKLLQSTSPNYLLLASIDAARDHMVTYGSEELLHAMELASQLRQQLIEIPGIYVRDEAYFKLLGSHGFDATKVVIDVSGLGCTGFQIYRELKDEFDVQLELAETNVILAIISFATTPYHIDQLLQALSVLSKRHYGMHPPLEITQFRYEFPPQLVRPREAFHAPKEFLHLDECVGEICAEMVMIYPPGIPLLIPGELITKTVISTLRYYEQAGSVIFKESEEDFLMVINRETWSKWEVYRHETEED